jgi:flagellar FliL protein
MVKILLIVNLIVMLGSAGLVYYSHNMIKRKPTDQNAELQSMLTDVSNFGKITPVKLKKLTINLYSRQTRLRFLDVELNILPFSEGDKKVIKDKENIITDSVIRIAGNMTPNELNSVSGKILLESRIRNDVNQLLGKNVIKEIFFSRFVIQ